MIDGKDPDLQKLEISLSMTDPFNKNENSVVDRAICELEQELKKIDPDLQLPFLRIFSLLDKSYKGKYTGHFTPKNICVSLGCQCWTHVTVSVICNCMVR